MRKPVFAIQIQGKYYLATAIQPGKPETYLWSGNTEMNDYQIKERWTLLRTFDDLLYQFSSFPDAMTARAFVQTVGPRFYWPWEWLGEYILVFVHQFGDQYYIVRETATGLQTYCGIILIDQQWWAPFTDNPHPQSVSFSTLDNARQSVENLALENRWIFGGEWKEKQ